MNVYNQSNSKIYILIEDSRDKEYKVQRIMHLFVKRCTILSLSIFSPGRTFIYEQKAEYLLRMN